eukprot:1158811-Pelagomonas_calceolata.AAC.3
MTDVPRHFTDAGAGGLRICPGMQWFGAGGKKAQGKAGLKHVDKCKTIVPKSQQQQQFNPEQAQHLAMHNGVGSTVLPPSSSQRHSPGPAATAPAPAAVAVPALSAQQGTQQQESDEHVAYIGNVAFEATEEDLQGLFAPFSCTLIRLHKDKNSGRPKGFAHAHFGDRASLDR